MAVLGKRLRSSDGDEPLLSLPSRTKRRTRSSIIQIHEDVSLQSIGTSQSYSATTQTPPKPKPLTPSPSKGNVGFKASPLKSKDASFAEQSLARLPQTPRHRDAASRKVFETPRHRVTMSGMPYTPCTPKTPPEDTRQTESRRSIYTDARRLFARSAGTDGLIGRDLERTELAGFVADSVQSRSSGCLYVSGPPGTGKSAFVSSICDAYKSHADVQYAYLNCMSIRSATDVYSHLVSELKVSDDVFGPLAKDQLSVAVSASDAAGCFLVVLDEIDQLLGLDMSTLYSLFEWSLTPSSRLILIGIANALDLTDRFLPELKARHLKPRLLPFLPYSAPEVASVISTRAKTLIPASASMPTDFIPLLTSQAVQLISKKVAAQTGDLRKAFDITYRIIDILESEAEAKLKAASQDESPSRAPLGEKRNTSSPSKDSRKASVEAMTFETAPRATLSHVLRVTNAAFTANSTASRLKTLNLQQRAVLCSLSALETRNQQRLKLQQEQEQGQISGLPSPAGTPTSKRMKSVCQTKTSAVQLAAPTVREVYDAYSKLCRTENLLHALSFSEFRDVLSNLETAGLMNGVDGRGSLVQVAPSTPSRKGRGSSTPALSMRIEDCRIKGTASTIELERGLEGPGCDVLRRMLSGEGF